MINFKSTNHNAKKMGTQVQTLPQTKTSVKIIDQEDQYQLLLSKKNLSKKNYKIF